MPLKVFRLFDPEYPQVSRNGRADVGQLFQFRPTATTTL